MDLRKMRSGGLGKRQGCIFQGFVLTCHLDSNMPPNIDSSNKSNQTGVLDCGYGKTGHFRLSKL